ncbi:MAG: LysM peptidoglycan-binding domain-containing protein [Clostridia bacterium]|nr:LysM peptidoglycan-binding domain-containing protein [Clostridia bacterium]
MQKALKQGDYVVIATLHESEEVNVKLTYKGEKNLDNMYTLNEFPYHKDDTKYFKILFDLFHSKNKPKDFVDFFVTNDNFYAVFKYHQAPNIPLKFKKGLITAKFEERCFLLENILIRIEKYYKSPMEFAGCISEPENICIDEENNVYFTFDLRHMDKYLGKNAEILFDHIHEIIYTILRPEADQGFNKQLHIVLDKCKNHVYTSIPELVIELRKAEVVSKASNWISYLKYRFSLYKPQILHAGKNLLTLVIVFGLIYIAYNKIRQGADVQVTNAVSIGNVNYSADKEDDSEKTLTSENESETQAKKAPTSNITLSEGLDMEYEDYIVQQGDTVASIAQDYYKDPKYTTAISTFNGIETNEKLTPGTILKLPNRTAIALYTSK